jgi:hypothetical protein
MNFLNNILVYKNTCFWLFIPIIIFNIIFFKKLPSFYLRKISHPIVLIETIARIITIAFSLIMSITLDNKIGKIGLLIYIICTMIYFSSYFVVIYLSDTIFGKNIIVLLAPYWTSVLFLIGIGLLGNKLFINIPYHYMIYIILAIIFSTIHTYHGYLCYTQK